MHFSAFEITASTPFAPGLPFRCEQRSRHVAAILRISVLAPLTLIMLAPFVTLLVHAVSNPSAARVLAAENAQSVVQLGLALVAISVLLGWPLARAIRLLGAERTITISDGYVAATERNLLGSERWSAPLTSFHGIAHRIGTTLSGTRHEIVLVGTSAKRHVLLATAPAVTDADMNLISAALGLPRTPTSALYRTSMGGIGNAASAANKVQAQIA